MQHPSILGFPPRAALAFVVAVSLACGGLGDVAVDEGSAPTRLSVGDAVKAPGPDGPQPGMVAALYGRLVQVRYPDGSAKWVEVGAVDPPGVAETLEPGEVCGFTAGTKVDVPTGTGEETASHAVTEVHGNMVAIADGRWFGCGQITATPVAAARPAPAPDNGRAAAISRCRSGCNKQCRGARNKAKCVGQCRRDCAR